MSHTNFSTTRWTMVQRAGGEGAEAEAALSDLCEAYWMPVYRFLKREGRNEDDSRELAQAFFAKLLATGKIDGVDPNKVRFRSYLLGALKHFLAQKRRDDGRQKRGGDVEIHSLESGGSETSPGLQVADPKAAVSDVSFDRQWALAVMERALEVVRNEMVAANRERQYEELKPWLVGDTSQLSQGDAAEALSLKPGAVKVAIHRLRQRYGAAVRHEIAQTVSDSSDVAEELRYLIEVLS